MRTTIVSEARDGKVTITLHMPYEEAAWLLDVVTDSVLHGRLRGVAQDWAEGLMRDLDDHLQRTDKSQDNSFIAVNTEAVRTKMIRCPYCGYYHTKKLPGADGIPAPCNNCGEV